MASNKKTEKQNKAFAVNEAFLRLRSNIEFSGVDNTMQVVNVVWRLHMPRSMTRY